MLILIFKNKYGYTALIIASIYGNMVNLLLGAHANPDIQDLDGMTALIIASSLVSFIVCLLDKTRKIN
jgi:ankyrin repeat protein